MDIEMVTLHKDGTVGLMYREEGELRCTCGWPGEEDTSGLFRTKWKWEIADGEWRPVHDGGPPKDREEWERAKQP